MLEMSEIISLTLPILLSGLAIIIVLKLRLFTGLDIPIDLKITLNGKRVFGENKTLKGIVIMVSTAVLVSYALYLGYKGSYSSYISPVFSKSPILIGIIYSFSYIMGELINSFIKRQLNISAGKITHSKFRGLQEFFDLSDGIIVAVIALVILTSASISHLLAAGLIGIFLHYCTDVLMRRLSLKQ